MDRRIMVSRIELASRILTDLQQELGTDASDTESLHRYSPARLLSKRQRDILLLIAEGYTVGEVAERLELSRRTVEGIIVRLKKANDYKNIVHMVADLIRHGML